MTTTILLRDTTYLKPSVARAWVAGWINGGISSLQVLQSDGTFGGSSPITSVPFMEVSAVPSITLSVATNGNDRLLFVVSPTQPDALTVTNLQPIQYTQFPYANTPGVAAPGPFDVFEFGMDAQDDVSAVNGFGLNLWFSVSINGTMPQFGARGSVTRKAIGKAFTTFVANEAKSLPAASAFAELLYDGAINLANAPQPPSVDSQFFAICDPNDMLAALTGNYSAATDDPLASYWDSTLTAFFAVGNYLSVNLSANPLATNIYSGGSSLQENPKTGVTSPAFTLSGAQGSFTFYLPLAANGDTAPGLTGAQYVFQQAFGDLTPAGSAGDAGLLQDNIWMALCRGVALEGVSTVSISSGESTTAWNNTANWYQAGNVSHVYSKFLHYAAIDGSDSRSNGTPIFHGSAAYGFSEDENPDGPYFGPNVPSKTTQNVPDGSTITLYVGPWDVIAA